MDESHVVVLREGMGMGRGDAFTLLEVSSLSR
jgi:hypothetical protein